MHTTGQFMQCLLAAVGGNNSLVIDSTSINYNYNAIVDSYRYNLDYPYTPAAIVFPKTTPQVADAVECAFNSGVKVQARSGGHSYGNYAIPDGELTIDLEGLQGFSFDNSTGLAKVGSGTHLGDVNEAIWNSGRRYVPHGVSFSVGIGGHATVGGFGQASRMAGLLIDNVSEVQMVLANSSIVRASASQNTDLLFAIKGAGASIGIVTEFVLKTEPAPTSVVSYTYSWTEVDSDSRSQLIKAWQAWIYDFDLPWELSATLTVSSSGTLLYGTFRGTQSEFEALNLIGNFTAPSTASADVYTDYRQLSVAWDELLNEAVSASRGYFYAKSLLWSPKTKIPDKTVDQLVEYWANRSLTQDVSLDFELLGGFTSTIATTATAYPHRDAKFAMLLYTRANNMVSKAAVNTLDTMNNIVKASNKNVAYGQYAGFVDPRQDLEEARRAYWGINLDRLTQIKAAVDPNDVFHNPQSLSSGIH
ncbi:FAD-binding domain-containing protein [Xylaria nigripes]|nr:FAD-binding domain-containing protein [Xylaria nigripes]